MAPKFPTTLKNPVNYENRVIIKSAYGSRRIHNTFNCKKELSDIPTRTELQ